jgi:3D (Asp-Asp-Asp) domain-containing protein
MMPTGTASRRARAGTRQALAAAIIASFSLALLSAPSRGASGIHVIVDGQDMVVEAPGPTVGDILSAAKVTLGERDQVTPALTAPAHEGDTIRVIRIETRTVTVDEKVPAPTRVRPPVSGRGPYHPTVTANGKPGLARRTYVVTLRDGAEAGKALVKQETVRAPVPAIVTARTGYHLASRGVYAGRRVFQMIATAYDPGPGSCPGTADGITCNGKRAGYGIAAVDPKVIPLGSKLYIEGYGYAIAADVGGAIKGNRIDLGYNSRGGAFKWGRRKVLVYVLD